MRKNEGQIDFKGVGLPFCPFAEAHSPPASLSTDAGGGAHVPALRSACGLMAYTHPPT